MLDFILSVIQVFGFVIAVGMVCSLLSIMFMSTVFWISQRRADKIDKEFFDQIERYRDDIS